MATQRSRILGFIEENPGSTSEDASVALKVSRAGTYSIISLLKKDGLIEEMPHPKRRSGFAYRRTAKPVVDRIRGCHQPVDRAPTQRKVVVDFLLKRPGSTARLVTAGTGLLSSTVHAVLGSLKQDNIAETQLEPTTSLLRYFINPSALDRFRPGVSRRRPSTWGSTLAQMPEKQVRSLLAEVIVSVKAGTRQGSSADVGDLVIADLQRAGIEV